MSYRHIHKGETSFDITFILYNRFIHYRGQQNPVNGKYWVEINVLYENGDKSTEVREWSRCRVNRMIAKHESENQGSISKMMETIQRAPDMYFDFCSCPHDRF